MAITYEHICNSCSHEWEAQYSIKADPPTVCPSCNKEGDVERLVSGGNGRGIVILTGGDLKARLMNDARASVRRARTDENYRANLIGPEKYHEQQLVTNNLSSELERIGKDASKIKSTDVKPSAKPSKIKRSSDT